MAVEAIVDQLKEEAVSAHALGAQGAGVRRMLQRRKGLKPHALRAQALPHHAGDYRAVAVASVGGRVHEQDAILGVQVLTVRGRVQVGRASSGEKQAHAS